MNNIQFFVGNKKTGIALTVVAASVSLLMLFFGFGFLAFVQAVLLSLLSLYMLARLAWKNKFDIFLLAPFAAIIAGILLLNIFWGAESFAKRLFYNLLFLIIPIAGGYLLYNHSRFIKGNKPAALITLCAVAAACLSYVFLMPLKFTPRAEPLLKGHNEYLEEGFSAKASAPNVLLINCDVTVDALSCYGGQGAPNLAALGEEGMVFENYYAGENREFALLTGRYPSRGYLKNPLYPTRMSSFKRFGNIFTSSRNADGILGDEITLAEALGAAGYACGYFGEWRLGDYGQYLPTRQGFDYFYGSYYLSKKPIIVKEEKGNAAVQKGEPADSILSQLNSYIARNAQGRFFVEYTLSYGNFDGQVGSIVEQLKSENVYDNTLIIFSGEANERFGRAPLIVTYPDGLLNSGTFNGKALTAPVADIDIFPTVLAFVGLDKPYDRTIDGVSLYSLLKGNIYGDSKIHDAIYFFEDGAPKALLKREGILGNKRDLIYYSAKSKSELYNSADSQRTNLIKSEAELASSLEQELREYAREFAKNRRGRNNI